MTAYSLSADTNIDALSPARTGGDTIDTNGFTFTIDQDTRYGLGGGTGFSFGNMTINASKGGTILVDARYVRLIPYDTGSGNVPAYNTTISQGSASGKLIGVYSSLTTAPVTPGNAMPASGYIKIKAWNGTAYAAGALSGISANATGVDVAGWIEVVGDEAATLTANRLGVFRTRGSWYEFLGTTTTGTRTTQYQLPTNGSLMYCPGVMVQSASASITAASWSSGIATYTASSHGFNVGQTVTITGASPSGYNVTDATITSVTTNTFTIAISNPGTWTSGGSAYVYDFYPNAGSQTALVANIATDVIRGKWCWVTTGGLVSFGYDGTNSTGAYIPPSGRKLRVPNIFFQNCTTAARTANVLPNATLATRYDFTTTGGGVLDIDMCVMNWYLSISQPFSCNISNCFTFEQISVSECASAMTWNNVGVGLTTPANTQVSLVMSLNFAGGTLNNVTCARIAQAAANANIINLTDISGFTFNNLRTHSLAKAGNATTASISASRVTNTTFNYTTFGGGRCIMAGCNLISFYNTTYYDHPATTTGTAIPMYMWDTATAPTFNLMIDGVNFGGLTLVQPYSGILNIGIAGCENITIRNLGTPSAPLDMGGAYVDATWTRATTTTTVTKTAHGLKAGDIIAVNVCSDVAPKAVTTTTATLWTVATAPTADTFTVTVTNAGQTTGQNLSYYPCMSAVIVNLLSSGATKNLKIQRCYTPHLRTGIIATADNSNKNITLDNVWGTEWGVQLNPMLNCIMRGIQSTPLLTAQTSCYGTHWFDFYTTAIPTNTTSVSWTRSTTTATVTSTAHGLRVGDKILVTSSSDTAAITLGIKTLAQPAAVASPNLQQNVLTFTCLNAGAASGTLTFIPLNGRIAIQMNEATSDTSSQVSLSGGAAFTSTGNLYMPTINDTAIFTAPLNITGHSSFPIAEAFMGSGTITNHDITYSRDNGTTWYNLSYPRSGAGGSTSSTNVTMTSTTGVAVNDYVFGTGIAPNAKVTSITNGTTIVVDKANVGTVSGILRFNHIPSETIADPLVGTPLKVKIVTTTTNTAAMSYLYIFTNSTTSARTATYVLDTVSITLTGLKNPTEVRVFNAGTTTEISNTGAESITSGSHTFTVPINTAIDISILSLGYQNTRLLNYTASANASLPISQVIDRQYQNA